MATFNSSTIPIELSTAPDVKRVITAAFPSYRRRKAFVSAFPASGLNVNSYWDGGSRSEYALVELATLKRRALPTSTHPYYDITAHGLANRSDSVLSVDHVGNVTLRLIPEGYALVAAGTFCGKPATAHIYAHPNSMPKFLAA